MLSVMERMDLVEKAESLAARKNFRELVEVLEEAPLDVRDSDDTLRYLLAYGYYMLGKELEARNMVRELRAAIPSINDRVFRRILNLEAIVEIELGNLGGAIELLAELQLNAEIARDNRYVAYSMQNYGIALDILGYPVQAITALQRARVAFQQLGEAASVAACAHNLGMCFRRINCLQVAEREFSAAAEHFAKHGSPEEATATALERALLLSYAGETKIARSAARIALARAEKLKNNRLRAEGLRAMGCILGHSGDLAGAQELLGEALAAGRTLGVKLLQAEALIELAKLCQVQGKKQESLSYARSAAQIFYAMGAPRRARELPL